MTYIDGTIPFATKHGKAEADYTARDGHLVGVYAIRMRAGGGPMMNVEPDSPLWTELEPLAIEAAEEEVKAHV